MRCAMGLCGSCVLGKYRVCVDGPVFTASQLREMKGEFGVSRRDVFGRNVPLGQLSGRKRRVSADGLI